MNPPLLEVVLQLHQDLNTYGQDELQYFHELIGEVLPESWRTEEGAFEFASADGSERLLLAPGRLDLRSTKGVSYPQLKGLWEKLLRVWLDVFQVERLHSISLLYWNEIPLLDLQSFQDYLNISIGMPRSLEERIEFFRSEFTYKYDFGEIRVWLQPDWDEKLDAYCLQLSLESIHSDPMGTGSLFDTILEMHEGIKDVFRQILSEDFFRQLPQ